MTPRRTGIPDSIAARVLFEHDRTCCVCRKRSKPVQLHHLDEDPSHHSHDNLAVLCFDCHRDTQLRGGFDRKLDADQIVLYRADWLELVRQQRARLATAAAIASRDNSQDVAFATSLAEIYRENKAYDLLAIYYNAVGNANLRDKYIEMAVAQGPSDQTLLYLREIQGRMDLIAADVITRELRRWALAKNWTQRARLLAALGRHEEAVRDYMRGVDESLAEGNPFSAAFYLREMSAKQFVDALFEAALSKAQSDGELWWQVRALQELGRDEDANALLVRHRASIRASGNLILKEALARAEGNEALAREMRLEIARNEESDNNEGDWDDSLDVDTRSGGPET